MVSIPGNEKLNLLQANVSFLYRSSYPEVFCKKDVFKNFTKFTGKHLCQNLFLNKVAGPAFI